MTTYTATVIDGQGGGLPPKVRSEIQELWRDMELGNDMSYCEWDEDEFGDDYPSILKFIADNNITGRILIHYWW